MDLQTSSLDFQVALNLGETAPLTAALFTRTVISLIILLNSIIRLSTVRE